MRTGVNPQTVEVEQVPIKVLIADDDPPTRILLRAAISQWGYTVVEAANGEEAWNILQQPDPPKLLIVDWLMPKLDGLSLCMRIKKDKELHTYTILLTQVTGTTNIIKGLEAGADEFLSKPFNMAELRSRLSVGARIVKFEHALHVENNIIQAYQDKIDALQTALSNSDYPAAEKALRTYLEEELTQRFGGQINITKDAKGNLDLSLQLPLGKKDK